MFHSTAEELRRYVDGLPFAVVDPRAVAPTVFSVVRQSITGARGDKPTTNLHPTGGRLGLPADFLIGSDGRVIACKHGTHANDQGSVDEVLAHGS